MVYPFPSTVTRIREMYYVLRWYFLQSSLNCKKSVFKWRYR